MESISNIPIGNPLKLFSRLDNHEKTLHATNNFMQAWNFSESNDPVERASEALLSDPLTKAYLFENDVTYSEALDYLVNSMTDQNNNRDALPQRRDEVFSRGYLIFLLRNTKLIDCACVGDYEGFSECLKRRITGRTTSTANNRMAVEGFRVLFQLADWNDFVVLNMNEVRRTRGLGDYQAENDPAEDVVDAVDGEEVLP